MRANLIGDVLVEFRSGKLVRYMDFELLAGPLKLPYRRQPQLGGSVGPAHNNHVSGTFGGYVELVGNNGSGKVYGLTCHHVLRPPRTSTATLIPTELFGKTRCPFLVLLCFPTAYARSCRTI